MGVIKNEVFVSKTESNEDCDLIFLSYKDIEAWVADVSYEEPEYNEDGSLDDESLPGSWGAMINIRSSFTKNDVAISKVIFSQTREEAKLRVLWFLKELGINVAYF